MDDEVERSYYLAGGRTRIVR